MRGQIQDGIYQVRLLPMHRWVQYCYFKKPKREVLTHWRNEKWGIVQMGLLFRQALQDREIIMLICNLRITQCMISFGWSQTGLNLCIRCYKSCVALYLGYPLIFFTTKVGGESLTLYNLVRTYDRTINFTRSISVCTSIILICSSSEVDGSPRKSCTASD